MGEQVGDLRAHVEDTQGEENPVQGTAFAGFNIGQDLGCQLVAHPVQIQKPILFQEIQVGYVLNQALADQDVAPLLAQAIYIHGAFADEVLEKLEKLDRARGVGAAVHGLRLRLDHLGATNRAPLRHLKHFLLAGAPFHNGADHLGNHVPGPFNNHPVADADILPVDVLFIVEGRLSHGGAADHHRLENGVGVEAAGAPHVDAYVQQAADRLLRREFVGDGPSGLPAHHAQLLLQSEGVYLDHHAINFVGQVVAFLQPFVIVIVGLGHGTASPVVGIDAKTQAAEPLQAFPMAFGTSLVPCISQGVDPNLEIAGRGYFGVQLADASRAGVPGVGVQWFA